MFSQDFITGLLASRNRFLHKIDIPDKNHLIVARQVSMMEIPGANYSSGRNYIRNVLRITGVNLDIREGGHRVSSLLSPFIHFSLPEEV
jgi:hypothetical protein